nr:MAG TPA: hypothetical protein [Caudoviricetes sp.]
MLLGKVFSTLLYKYVSYTDAEVSVLVLLSCVYVEVLYSNLCFVKFNSFTSVYDEVFTTVLVYVVNSFKLFYIV